MAALVLLGDVDSAHRESWLRRAQSDPVAEVVATAVLTEAFVTVAEQRLRRPVRERLRREPRAWRPDLGVGVRHRRRTRRRGAARQAHDMGRHRRRRLGPPARFAEGILRQGVRDSLGDRDHRGQALREPVHALAAFDGGGVVVDAKGKTALPRVSAGHHSAATAGTARRSEKRDGSLGTCRPAHPAAPAALSVDRDSCSRRVDRGERAEPGAAPAAGAARLVEAGDPLTAPHDLEVVARRELHRHAAALDVAVADGGGERRLERPHRVHQPVELARAKQLHRLRDGDLVEVVEVGPVRVVGEALDEQRLDRLSGHEEADLIGTLAGFVHPADAGDHGDRGGELEDALALLERDRLPEVVRLQALGDRRLAHGRQWRGHPLEPLHPADGAAAHLREARDEVDDVLPPPQIAFEVERVVGGLEVPALALTVLDAELAHEGARPVPVLCESGARCVRGAAAARFRRRDRAARRTPMAGRCRWERRRRWARRRARTVPGRSMRFIASSVVPKRTESPVGASCTIPLDGRRSLAVRRNSHNICIRRETIATTGE